MSNPQKLNIEIHPNNLAFAIVHLDTALRNMGRNQQSEYNSLCTIIADLESQAAEQQKAMLEEVKNASEETA